MADEAVAMVDGDGGDVAALDVGEHPVPPGPLAVALPRRPGVVGVDLGDVPAEPRAQFAADPFLVGDLGAVVDLGDGDAAVDARALLLLLLLHMTVKWCA